MGELENKNQELNQNKKTKKIGIIIAICAAVIAGLILFSVGMYNVFYNNNKKSVETLAENKSELTEQDNEEMQIELIDAETLEEPEEQDKEEEKEEDKLSEEEKQKLEEERKKKEEEKRKQYAQKYPYYIKVNYSANTVTIYSKDNDGNYTVPVKAMVCSTGKSTPRSGVYKTPQRAQWGNLIGSYGQYCTRITGQILFHSVPYWTKYDKTSLEYMEYDRLGETRSLGCIRLTVIDAKWIYDNCPLGTSVEFYSSSNPGPLGKPSAQKISGYEEPLKNWDPTDPDPNNPWHNYNAQQAQKKAEEEQKAAEEAKRKEEEERKAQEEAKRKAQEEKKAQEEAKRKEEEEKKAQEEAEKKAEEEKKAQEEAKRKEEEEKKAQEEAEKKAEEEKKTQEKENKEDSEEKKI